MEKIKYTQCQLKFDSKKLEYNQNGYLKVNAYVAKVGIVSRVDPKTGETCNEFVTEESLFSKESLDSLIGIPVTQFHPALNGTRILLDTQTTAMFQKGFSVGIPEKIKTDGEIYLSVPILITDSNVINDVVNNITPEISLGYRSKDKKFSGFFKNINYNYVQEKRINNHIALERNGNNRSGSDVRVKMDSQDGQFIHYENINIKNEDKRMDLVKMKCDSKEIEVTEVAQLVLESKFKADAKEITDLKALNLDLQNKYDSERAKTDEQKELIKKLDSYKSKIEIQEKDGLLKQITPILGSDFKFDGKTAFELKKETIKKLRPDLNLDNESEGYILGRFDTIMENKKYDSNDNQAFDVKKFSQELHKKTDSQTKDTYGLNDLLD